MQRAVGSLLRRPAAVDGIVRAGDRSGFFAREERGQCRHLLDGDELPRRLPRQHLLLGLRLRDVLRLCEVGNLLLDERRPNEARRDSVRRHAVLGELQRHRFREASEPVLGGHVGRLEGRGPQRMRRADVDDAPPLARLHAGHRRPHAVKGRGEVDGDDGVPLLDGKVLDGAHVLDAGVVDEDVDAAEIALGLGDHLRDLRRPQHVGRVEADLHPQRLHALDRLGVVLGRAQAVRDDVDAGLGEPQRDAEADPRRGARHDCRLALDAHG